MLKLEATSERALEYTVQIGKINFQDFGIGIAREHQHKIFERFYQVTDNKEKTYPGLGIGLYISCQIVRRHGGKLWVESEKGEGATFHVTLPLSQSHT